MIWNIFEILATIIEHIIWADFIIKYLRPKKDNNTLLCYFILVVVDSTITFTLNSLMAFEGFLCIIYIIVNFIISLIFFKDKIYEKLFAIIIIEILPVLINFMTLTILSYIFQKSINELIVERDMLRIFILFITKFLLFIVTRIFIRIKRDDTYSFSKTEWLTISMVFFITLSVAVTLFLMSVQYHLSMKSPLITGAGIGLILINIFTYILMTKISRNNHEKSMLIIDKMQMELYESQLEASENRYNEFSKVRHDMRNHIQCIQLMLKNNEIAEAQEYVDTLMEDKLYFGVNFVNTENKIVNIISNSKLLKCQNENINVKVCTTPFTLNMEAVDICTIFGNIFDNAIEACKNMTKKPIISFSISQKQGIVNIILKNTIEKSVLKNNPKLITNKKNQKLHGIGLKSVKDTVKKYNGVIEFYEDEENFIVEIWI